MKRLWLIAIAGLFLASSAAVAEGPIPAESRLYIEPMPNDLDVYIKAEIVKRRVPIQVVSYAEDADLVMSGASEGKEKKAWHEGWLTAQTDKVTGAIIINDLNGNLVWAAEAGDRSLWFTYLKRGGQRKVAERLVKQLKKAIGSRAQAGTSRIGGGAQDWWRPVNPDLHDSPSAVQQSPEPNRTVRMAEGGSAPERQLAPGQTRQRVKLTQGMSPAEVEDLLGKPDRFEGDEASLRYFYSDTQIEFAEGKLESVTQVGTDSQTRVQELVEGMPPADVEAILGQPERKVKIGEKVIYFYERMKLTFVDGALKDIE
ncbi:MAG TPA: DUF4309 domain-containing protein [Acidobacteriota bacterium]|nr:DUF4309 domain-containing protein [Acidobacteriota bacterium]